MSGRFMWVPQEQRDAAQQYASSMRHLEMDALADFLDGLVAEFDDAPRDAVAQLAQVLLDASGPGMSSQDYRAAIELAEHQARALGAPPSGGTTCE